MSMSDGGLPSMTAGGNMQAMPTGGDANQMGSMNSPQEQAYEYAHPQDSLQTQCYVLFGFMAAISIISVALRFWTRRISAQKLHADDYLVFAAMLVNSVYQAILMYLVHLGLGRHSVFMTEWSEYALYQYIGYPLNPVAMALLKLSLIFLYIRLFPVRWFTWAMRILAATVACMAIAVTLVLYLGCKPISSGWAPTPTMTCVNAYVVWLFAGSWNVFTDILILVAPLPHLWHLQISFSRKVQLVATFAVGGFILVVSIVRTVLISSFMSVDATMRNVPPLMWASTEVGIGTLCACLPTFRILYNRYVHGSVNGTRHRDTQPRSLHGSAQGRQLHITSTVSQTHEIRHLGLVTSGPNATQWFPNTDKEYGIPMGYSAHATSDDRKDAFHLPHVARVHEREAKSSRDGSSSRGRR